MSEPCAVSACNRASCALCHCCQQNVCIVHLNEHNDVFTTQLKPLADLVNTLDNRLKTINIQKTIGDYRQKLEQWRVDSQKRIDHFFEQKCQDLDRLVAEKIDQQREEINRLQSKISGLIREQQATRQDIYTLTSTIDHLERQINTIGETFLEVQTNPIVLDCSLISIKGINEEEYDLSILSPVHQTITRSDKSYGALASSNRYLLIHQAPNLCLIAQDLTIVKQIPWRYGMIYDMCWSSTLGQFIGINAKNVFLVDERTMSIENVKTIEKRKWFSCACSDHFLYLSTNEWGSSITKITLDTSHKFSQQWQSPNVCKIDEYIDGIAYNKKTLAMIVRNKSNNTIRMELRSSGTLDCIWSCPLDILWNPSKPFHCCSFIDQDWLVADYENGRLLHVTKGGKVKSVASYNAIPYCVTMFGPNMLAVSAKDGINFHILNYTKTYTICVI
jgi:polyhydroxyalkanoate synthesis regulator phasin